MPLAPRSNRRPVVLLVFANDRRTADGVWLRQLPSERRAIASALFRAEQDQHCRIVDDANVTHRTFFDMVVRHRKDIVGVHFGGHADPGGLHFEDAHGKPVAARMDAIAQTLGALPALRWVFLNGCGTADHVAVLHGQVDVPVVATERAIRDDIACSFAERFYMSLSNGHPLGLAFGFAESEVRSLHPDATGVVRGGLEAPEYFQSRLLRPADGSGPARWPWVLRYPAGDEACLQWQLVPSGTRPELAAVTAGVSEAPTDARPARPSRPWVRSSIVLLMAAAVGLGIWRFGRGPTIGPDVGIPEGGVPVAVPPTDGPVEVQPTDVGVPDGPVDGPPTAPDARPPAPPPPRPRPRCPEAGVAEVVGLFAAGRCLAGAGRRENTRLPHNCVGRAAALERMDTAAAGCARRCGQGAANAARADAVKAYDQACRGVVADFVARCPETDLRPSDVACPHCGDGRKTHEEICDPKDRTGPPCLPRCQGLEL